MQRRLLRIALAMSLLLVLSGMLPWLPTFPAFADTDNLPNILVLMSDDVGWTNISTYYCVIPMNWLFQLFYRLTLVFLTTCFLWNCHIAPIQASPETLPCPKNMVLIPKGTFSIGSNTHYKSELSAVDITVDSFLYGPPQSYQRGIL